MNSEGEMDLAVLGEWELSCKKLGWVISNHQSILTVHLFWGSLLKAMTVTGLVR